MTYNLYGYFKKDDRHALIETVGSEQEAQAVAIPVSQAFRGEVDFLLFEVDSPEDRIMASLVLLDSEHPDTED